jgi:hypothetical protein
MITREIVLKEEYELSSKEKRKIYLEIIDWWNICSPGPAAKESKGSKNKVYSLLSFYTGLEIKEAIKKYLDMYIDEEFYFNYKWTFSSYFNVIRRMLRENGSLRNTYENYLIRKEPKEPKEPNYFEVEHYNEVINMFNQMNYNDYLNTEHWKHFRKETLKFYNNRCVICSSEKNLNVHHKNYSNRGRETFNDVIVVCNKCHKEIHQMLDKRKEEYWEKYPF